MRESFSIEYSESLSFTTQFFEDNYNCFFSNEKIIIPINSLVSGKDFIFFQTEYFHEVRVLREFLTPILCSITTATLPKITIRKNRYSKKRHAEK